MAGLPVPDDHNLSTDPYTVLCVTVPDSPLWRGVVKGQLLDLADAWRWDSVTGDADAAAEAGYEIFDSLRGTIDGGTA